MIMKNCTRFYLAVREFMLGQNRGAWKHLVADITLLTSRRDHVRHLDMPFQLTLRLERQRTVDALLTVLVR